MMLVILNGVLVQLIRTLSNIMLNRNLFFNLHIVDGSDSVILSVTVIIVTLTPAASLDVDVINKYIDIKFIKI